MAKFSVKKPLTVFVAVIAVLVLGVVAYLKMTPDLLPNMDFPYVVLVTTYPGASPEKVEQELTKPMEQSMATLEHIKSVTSTSSENYSLVMLEFEESVDLDTIGVDIQQNIAALSAGWDDMVGTPYVLKINPSILPVMVAAVSKDGMDMVELTEHLDTELLNKLEGISGVARVSTSGMIRQELHVVLDQTMIDQANKKVTEAVTGKMDDALSELEESKGDLESAKEQMKDGKEQLNQGGQTAAEEFANGEAELTTQSLQLLATRDDLLQQLQQLRDAKTQLETMEKTVLPLLKALDTLLDQVETQEKDLAELRELKNLLADIDSRQAAFDAQIAQIEADASLSAEEKATAIAQLKESEAYQTLETDRAAAQEKLTRYSVTAETIDARIALTETALTELNQRITELENLLKDQDIDLTELRQQMANLDETKAQLDAGIAALEDGIKQIDAGMLQLKDAQAMLSKTKTEALLQMVGATTELAVGESTVTAALTQIEGGIDTLEDTREETLKQTDLNKLLTMEMIGQILTAQNFAMPAGMVEQDGISYMVSVGQEITTSEELENLLLFDMGIEGVEPVYLKDVAAVMVTDNRAQTYAKLDGQDSVMLTFEKQSTYATAETTDNIIERFAQLENQDGTLHFVPLMNQGDYIYMIVESILSSLLLGSVFAVIVLFLFLWDLRPTFITLCSIPISVIFAVVLMYFSGVTINMISLSGLAVSVGMLVDNSVVVIENIYRLRAKGANPIQAAVSGAKQVAGAVTASTLTTVCVFLPIVFVEGITKQLFTDLALTMTYSLMASLIVSLTLVPAMASGMLRKQKVKKFTLMDKFNNLYGKTLEWALRFKPLVIVLAAVLLVASMVLSLIQGFIFMPEMDMPNVSVTVTMPEDATMEEAVALSDEVLKRIETLDGIATAGATMGGTQLLSMGTGGGSNDVTIYIILEDEGDSGAAMGKQIEALCADMDCEVSASSAMMDLSMLTGSGISVRVYGNDMEQLQKAAKDTAEALKKVKGVTEVSDGLEEAADALHIRVDRNKAMAQSMTVAQIYMELAAALQNETTVTTLNLDGTATDLIVERPKETVLTAEELEQYEFNVTTQTGEEKTFLLSDVAQVEQTTSLNTINRMEQRRYLNVTAQIDENENVTLVTNRARRALNKVRYEKGTSYVLDGENEAIMDAIGQLVLMLLLGIVLVYLVMVAQFQSLKSPFIVMFTIPLAFTGGFLGLLIFGMELSVISLIGFVMLTGIIVNNGIVLVDYINQLRLEGMERRAAIVEAGKTRMRPILMTTITTILGLIDMAVRQNVGTSLMQPVAVVCIGGLTYATLMTLYVVPCIYDMMNKKELRKVKEEDLKILDI